jgi:hypothetical protein
VFFSATLRSLKGETGSHCEGETVVSMYPRHGHARARPLEGKEGVIGETVVKAYSSRRRDHGQHIIIVKYTVVYTLSGHAVCESAVAHR